MKFIFVLGGIVLVFSSCFVNRGPVVSYNSPAFHNNDVLYQPKPILADSVHHAAYVSASVINGDAPNANDQLSAGALNLGMAFTLKHFNFAYGVFGAAGTFENGTIPPAQDYYFTKKFVGLTGERASINYYITSGHVDIRIIGLEATYSHEFGSYADFRRQVAGQPNFFSDPRTNLFTWGGSSEVIWYSRDPSFIRYGFRLFIGQTNATYEQNNYFSTYSKTRAAASLAYFMQLKRYYMSVDLSEGAHFTLGYCF